MDIHNDTAAVIMEPIIFDFPRLFIKSGKLQTKKVLLILMIWTGFTLVGRKNVFKIDADLACYSKAVANGMPL